MKNESAPNPNEQIKSAIERLITKKATLEDPLAEMHENEKLADIILGKEASKIYAQTDSDSHNVALIIISAAGDPKNNIKLLALKRIVELLPAGHPLITTYQQLTKKGK